MVGNSGTPVLCYGIEFEYSKIKNLKEHPEFEEMRNKFQCNDFPMIWGEFEYQISGLNKDCINAEEDDYYYIIGKEIDNDKTLSNFLNFINENQTKKIIKDICLKYGLDYKEPTIICRATNYL